MTATEKLMADVISLIESGKTASINTVESKIEALSFAIAIKSDILEAMAEASALTDSDKDAYSLQFGHKLFSVLGVKL